MCDFIYQSFEAHLQTDVGRWKALDIPSSELYVPLHCQEEDSLCVAPTSLRLKAIVPLCHADTALLSIHTCNTQAACIHVILSMYMYVYSSSCSVPRQDSMRSSCWTLQLLCWMLLKNRHV